MIAVARFATLPPRILARAQSFANGFLQGRRFGVAIVVGPRLSFRGEDDSVAVRICGEHVVQGDGEDRDGEGDGGHAF